MTDDRKSRNEKLLFCSFCGKSQHEVSKLIAGPSVYICNECENLLQTDINGKDYKRIEKSLCKECKNKDKYVTQLKEMLTDVR